MRFNNYIMTVSKKNGKWYCRFQLNGERHHYLCSGATTEKEAIKLENQFLYKLQQQQNGVIPKETPHIKFKKLYQLYDTHASLNKRSYQKDLSFVKVLKLYFSESEDATIKTPNDFELFKSKIMKDRGVAPVTVNKYLNILSKMYSLGVHEKLLKENPLVYVDRFLDKNYVIRYLKGEEQEEERLYKAIRELRPHIEDLVTCALQTAMRKGEIFHLTWFQINFEYEYIHILESKSGKARKIPISKKLMNIFKKLPRVSEYVFINPETGKPYTDIKHSWQTVMEAAGIENFRFHDLRHTAITRMVEKGIPLPVVKEIAGHSKIETTMRYTHTSTKQKIEAIEVLNSYC